MPEIEGGKIHNPIDSEESFLYFGIGLTVPLGSTGRTIPNMRRFPSWEKKSPPGKKP